MGSLRRRQMKTAGCPPEKKGGRYDGNGHNNADGNG
jgi:hypothetical protein